MAIAKTDLGELRLADSDWPRTGRDLRNSALAPFDGATTGKVEFEVELPTSGAVVVAEGGELLVGGKGTVVKLTPTGSVLWAKRVEEKCSAPLALAGGLVLVNSFRTTSHLLDPEGQPLRTWTVPGCLDDSGPSLTLTMSGKPLLSGQGGDIWLARGREVRELGCFGYDILPPAVLPTGEIAISGYYGKGACLVEENGTLLWQDLDHLEADSLVTANSFSEIAFAALNTLESVVLDRTGTRCFCAPYFATFSEHPDGWVAVSHEQVRLLSRSGRELWSLPIATRGSFGTEQAACDRRGNIYVPLTRGVAALDRTGRPLFLVELGDEPPRNVALTKGRLLCVCENRLFCIK